MIKEIIDKWSKNNGKLKEWFETRHPESYEKIVEKLFELVINDSDDEWENFDITKMTVIDDGDCRGTEIFIIPKECYEPSAEDYLVTDNEYGSCCGCDTLQIVRERDPVCDSETPSEDQIKDYMVLALHLVQKLRWLSEGEG